MHIGRTISAIALLLLAAQRSYAGGNCFAWGNTVGYNSTVSPKPKYVDSDLWDPWGVAFLPGDAYVVADSYNGKSTVYDATGLKKPQVLQLPLPAGSSLPHSYPTGLVANLNSQDFVNPGTSHPIQFIYSTIEGTIVGWSKTLSAPELIVDNSSKLAVYYGAAIGNNVEGEHLYLTNFHSKTIDVFDASFAPVTLPGAFTDPGIPAGFAPFGITNIRDNLFVTYAAAAGDNFKQGKKQGYVDIFDTNGKLVTRFAANTHLNAPWGVVEAPANFGNFGGDILVGNFGDGTINAYDPAKGTYKGSIVDSVTKKPMSIPGLWALFFGGGEAGDPGTLYFTARLSETFFSGGFGPITPQSAKQCSAAVTPY